MGIVYEAEDLNRRPARGAEVPAQLSRRQRRGVRGSARWMLDSQSVSFVLSADGALNVWSMPLSGGSAKQITHFKEGDIYNYAWAANSHQLIVARGHQTQDVVLIRDWR